MTPGYNFEDKCSFFERIDDSATAGNTSICGAFGNVSFPKVYYKCVYILSLPRSMTTIALFLR